MNKQELYDRMFKVTEMDLSPDEVHEELDGLLLEYVDDERISSLFKSTPIWYA